MNQPLNLNPPNAGAQSSKPLRHWAAHLRLEFAAGATGTRLAECEHKGPLRVQRLFHPDPDGTAHCYLLHPPGGVVLGDQLTIEAGIRSGSALLTTPSAGRFYGVGDFSELQEQDVHLTAADGASLAWLPQETILFSGSNGRLHNEINLDAGARLSYWDIVVLGRPAAGERFTAGSVEQKLRVRRGGRVALEERLALRAGDRFSQSAMGLRGASTWGTCLLAGDTSTVDARELEGLQRNWLADVNNGHLEGSFFVSQRLDILIARYLGEDAAECRHGFSALWRAFSEQTNGVRPSEPRIWHT